MQAHSRLRRLCVGLALALPLLASAQGTLQKVKFSVNPSQVIYLPLFLAVDKGYFRDAGLDVQVMPYKGSANTQMPLLARGDVDISSVVAGPAMFNQLAEGFNIRLVAALTEPRQGYQDGVALVVRKDLWDANAIRTPADLKGRKVDGAAEGNPIDFLLRSTLASANLGKPDVTLSYKPRSPSDTPEILRQKVVDVAGVSEPTATLIEREGIAVRWLSYKDVVPWYQETFLATSETFLKERPDAVRRFLVAYLRAVNEIAGAKGSWTPELLATAKKWTGMPEDLILKIGKLPYWDPSGAIRLDALERVQQFWAKAGLVKKPAPIATVADQKPLALARENK
ncbi:MAG TPA: ABC transporter substrate-binding protein [Ramlibacter sp.]|nr:ABC transporter substrate-binding protein [Ramlibacter sp.]